MRTVFCLTERWGMLRTTSWSWILTMAAACHTATACAEVKLPAVFSDHMVVQADAAIEVWGWASPGEEVAVSLADQSTTSRTGADGKWAVKLGKLKASDQPQTMVVRGRNVLTVHDVLIGEVWLAAGQSNMEMQIKDPMHGSVDRVEEEIAAADHPVMRMFVQDPTYSIHGLSSPPREPLADRPGAWRVCSPQTAAGFSAIGYFFARDLHRQLRSPVGIVLAAVGGTPIEAWTSLEAQRAEPALRPLLDDWQQRLAHLDAHREQTDFLQAKAVWLKERSAASKRGQMPPKAPPAFKNLEVMSPGGLFHGLIAPLTPYTVRGVLWYQGERNAAGPFTGLYGVQLKTLINDWRTRWGAPLYFAWVQLPRFKKEQLLPSEAAGWGVSVREDMRKALTLPRTGMTITIDLGGATDGHPANKAEYARRLSLLALHDVYRLPVTAWSGPLFRTAERNGNQIVITFDHAIGLRASSGEVKGFAIAGNDRKFVWAHARIVDDKVVVWADVLHDPAAVRYAWAANPTCNLVNGEGLPASPFRTDDWE